VLAITGKPTRIRPEETIGRAIFLSRLLGLYYTFTALSMILHKQTFVETVTGLLHNAPVMFLVSIITLLAGLAMVLVHNILSGGAVSVIVTLIGWITLIKGFLFVFLSQETQAKLFLTNLHYAQLFYVYTAISFVLGMFLTHGGFTTSLRPWLRASHQRGIE
jgi:hypothetical protein